MKFNFWENFTFEIVKKSQKIKIQICKMAKCQFLGLQNDKNWFHIKYAWKIILKLLHCGKVGSVAKLIRDNCIGDNQVSNHCGWKCKLFGRTKIVFQKSVREIPTFLNTEMYKNCWIHFEFSFCWDHFPILLITIQVMKEWPFSPLEKLCLLNFLFSLSLIPILILAKNSKERDLSQNFVSRLFYSTWKKLLPFS